MAKRMAEQMELFEPVERGFDEGGLMDEGGTIDPVSGNDVPPGSMQEEVRDDIPAQLSEGEFVFPADVVRYIGLENLMRMRQEAKQGLAQMEAMGQMGNSEEATVQDDLPFDMYDLDVEDEGTLNMQAGGMATFNPQTGTYSMPGTGIGGFQPAQQPSNTGFTPYTGSQPYMQPLQYTGTQFTTAGQTTNIPTFNQMVGSGYQGSELRTYVNDAGQTIQIPFVDGKPVFPIPDGYQLKEDQPQQAQPTTQLSGPTTTVTDQGGSGPEMTDVPTTTTSSTISMKDIFTPQKVDFPDSYSDFQNLGTTSNDKFGGSDLTMSSSAYRNAVAKLGATQFGSLSPVAYGASVIAGKIADSTGSRKAQEMSDLFDFRNRSAVGNQVRDQALAALGMISPAQVYDTAQFDFIGQAMNNAMANQKGAAGQLGLTNAQSMDRALQGAIYDNFDTIKETVDTVSKSFLEAQGIDVDTVNVEDVDFADVASAAIDRIGNLKDASGVDVGRELSDKVSPEDFEDLPDNIKDMYNSYTTNGTYSLTRTNRLTQDLLMRQKQNINRIVTARQTVEDFEKPGSAGYEGSISAAKESARRASRDFTGKEADPGGSLAGVDRGDGREATFGGPGSDMAPGGKDTADERAEADRQSADMGVFGP